MKRNTWYSIFIMLALIISLFLSDIAYAKHGVPKVKPGKANKPAEKQKEKSAGVDLVYAADIISVKGNGMRIKRITSPHWLRGRLHMANYVKDILETDSDTIACIEFLNGSQLGINKDARIEIISTSDVRDITRRGIIKKIMVKAGTVWAKITRKQPEGFSVETNRGVLGVKGTEFVVQVDPVKKEEKVTVLEGRVSYQSGEAGPKILNPGDVLSLLGGGMPRIAQFAVSDLQNQLRKEFPALNPQLQSLLAVKFGDALSSVNTAQLNRALGQAHALQSQISHMDALVQQQLSKVKSQVPGGFGNIPFGGRISSSQKKEVKQVKNLAPNQKIVSTYFPKFTWDKLDGVDRYRVMVTLRPIKKDEKNPGYYAMEEIKENSFVYPKNARYLKPGVTYYWMVIPLDSKGKLKGKPSEPGKFTMADLQTLGLRGLYPSGEIQAVSGSMVFEWLPINGVTRYQVDISASEDLSEPFVSQQTDKNYIVLEEVESKLKPGITYFWKVAPVEKDSSVPDFKVLVNSFKMVEKEVE